MRVWEAPLFNFNYGFNDVSAVFYNRYPNSFAKHIISEDVISREITEERIITRKLIVKKAASFLKSVPSWMSRLTSVQYMPTIEESVFDKKNMTLKTYTRNICWKNILNMDERCIYQSLESNKTIVSRSLYLSVTYGKISGLVERILLMTFKNSIRKTTDGFNEKLKERFGHLYSSGGLIASNSSSSPNLIHDTIMKKLEKA